jgi:hypothetical protein
MCWKGFGLPLNPSFLLKKVLFRLKINPATLFLLDIAIKLLS